MAMHMDLVDIIITDQNIYLYVKHPDSGCFFWYKDVCHQFLIRMNC